MLQKGFLRNKYKFEISKKKFWTSIVVGLITSFSIYTFFCLFRFVFRTIDFGSANWALIIDPKDRYWQNFLFALGSLVFGNSIFILSLFKKPIKFSVRETRRSNIINNQYFLVFNYFYLFIKLVLFVTLLALSFVEFSMFLNPFKNIVFLIVIVLFLESWKSVIRIYRVKSYKYIVLDAVVIVLLAFSFSFTSVFDYEKYDTNYELSNPYIEFPKSNFISKNDINFSFKKLKIWKHKHSVKYSLDGQKANDLNELVELIETSYFNQYYYRRIIVFILASKDIDFSEIKKIEKLLFGLEIKRIKYVVDGPSGYSNRYSTEGIHKFLRFKDLKIDNFWLNNKLEHQREKVALPSTIFFRNKNFIDVEISDKYYINEMVVPKEKLVDYFKSRINDSIVFHFHYNESIIYQKYITMYSAYIEAIDYLRSNDQIVKPKGGFYYPENKEEYEEDQRRLKSKYPVRYIENTDISSF